MAALDGLFSRLPSFRGSGNSYQPLPTYDRGYNDSNYDSNIPIPGRRCSGGNITPGRRVSLLFRASPKRLSLFSILSLSFFIVIVTGALKANRRFNGGYKEAPQNFSRLNGFYNGIRSLVPYSDWIPEQKLPTGAKFEIHDTPPFSPQVVNPFPNFTSDKYLKEHHPVNTCYLDEDEKYPAPDIYAYPGIPAMMTAPTWGSYETLGIAPDRCYERFGRFGPYGYSYDREEGGLGLSRNSAHAGAGKLHALMDKVDYRKVNWAGAQKRCFDKNKDRFGTTGTISGKKTSHNKKKLSRSALVLRTWTGYGYSDAQLLTMRAMINELSLQSGGEFDVHLLVHVKDNSLPIWASEEIYTKTLRENVPEEFWDIATLWSERQLQTYYPGPFLKKDNVANHAGADIYGVYRAAHFALQWFSQQHQEYDFVWNWEMDIRYTGHYYEFLNGASEWAAKQPRKLMWERSARFWIPEYHGSWRNFSRLVEKETAERGDTPVWGPVSFPTGKYDALASPDEMKPPTTFAEDDYEWGVGEPADLITFDPLFDPSKTTWVFRDDVTGYDTTVATPPRRAAIVTVARLSRRLLNTMHEETWRAHHTMFPEMWAPSVALHHGYKALYAPHPIYFDRNWPLDVLDKTFNRPKTPEDSPFGRGEHNMQGGTFYYNAGFSGALWRRWLGAAENGEGGRKSEEGTDRMCLRPVLHHPIKHEAVE
ncbi:hypothetical protein F5Y03DRAFT_405438 [Xylaria venustula]|nr:hypothetical protein F5Y03DRAFT_405438 [Xylaria venustula]